MPRTGIVAAALALLALAAGAAEPAKVYRCGSRYQDTPCEGQSGQVIQPDDARTPAQRREAQAVARDEARLGDSMERDRRAREKALRPAAAVGIGAPVPASAPASSVRHAKKKHKGEPKDAKDFVAVQPKPVKGR